jgi:hypothetical protein
MFNSHSRVQHCQHAVLLPGFSRDTLELTYFERLEVAPVDQWNRLLFGRKQG